MSEVVPPQRRLMSREAMAFIRERILDREFVAGDVLRPEDIGKELGISQTPAREALQALRTEGFLDNQQGVGFVVNPLTADDIRDIFTAHALIAGEIAARAAKKVTDEDLDELDAIQFELLAAAKRRNPEGVEEHNHALHSYISRLGGSAKLNRILSIVSHYVPRSFYGQIEGWPSASAHDHDRILNALRERDADEARAAMHEHIVHAGVLLAERLDD